MFKREEAAADDDFVTKTNKSRKKSSKANANGDDAADASGSGNGTSGVKEGGASAAASSGSEGISLRPRTMFTVKGRGQTEADGSPAYRPQWSKDGDGFVSNMPSGKDADSDANRRKGKVVRYSKEELLALHVDTQAPPKFLVETAVASEISLPPVGKLPFDYEEIYKQWALNRNRGRGRGRTTGGGQNNNEGGNNNTNERSRSNGKWDEQPKWDKPKRGDDEENSWERGTSSRSNDRRGDIWDDVGTAGGDSGDFDLSSMAAAAEKFRLEMDAMRDQELEKLREAAVVDMDAFDQKLESAAATGQFEDSDEEVAWDMPLEAELPREVEDSPLAFQASQFDQKLLSTNQPSLALEEPSFSLSSLSEATFGLGALTVEVADEWFYLDPQGLQQGPFKTAEMREWFEAGYFKPNLPIRFGREGGNFTPLANHFVQGQLPFATVPRPTPKVNLEHEMRIREQQRLMELHQQQQQQQQMMQLQQQQEQQRMLQFNQEEKIRLEMQRLEMARQQQNQMFQQQQQLMQQQQQQQQQQMLLQQQSSWQRSQREGIMSALGIFGGDSGLGVNDRFHQEPPAPFQSDFRGAHQFDVNPPTRIQEPAFSHNAQRIDDPWGGVGNARAFNEPVSQPGFFGGDVQAQQMRLQEPSLPETPKPQADGSADPWRKPPTEVTTESVASRHKQEPTPVPAPQQPAQPEQPSPAKEKSKSSPAKKQPRPTEAPKQTSAWANAPTSKPASSKTLKDIQADEQRELRKSLEQDDSSLAQMGAQLKMMLGVNALAGAAPPQPAAQRAAPPQPAVAPSPAPVSAPAPAPAPAPAAPSAPAPSPWGRTAVVAPTLKASKSMREILEEEERLAAERAKRIENTPTSSHWSNVVAGTAPTPPVVPKVSRLGPVPASVLKSTTRSRTSVTGESISGPAKAAVTTPSKAESDASFWNFGAAGAAKTGSTPSSASPSGSFGSASAPSDFMSWCAKQVKAINGSDDLTLVEYCAGLEDPVEIRENLSAYLGSTPRVSAFATEFIQRKKSMPSAKKAADAFSTDDANGKKGKRRTKGQKVDPSLLNYSVGS